MRAALTIPQRRSAGNFPLAGFSPWHQQAPLGMLPAMRTLLVTLHSKYIHGSLALPYLAAYCGAEAGELRLLEFTVHEPKDSVLAALLAQQPQVVAFSVYLWNRRETLELIDALTIAAPQLRTVVGGPEVSFDGPELFARHPGLTALVRGEGEIPLSGLLRAWNQGAQPRDVPRLLLRQGDQLIEGPDSAPIDNLDTIPSPFALGLVALDRGLVYYETSRGCPYSCSFCMSALDSRVRSFSQARIEADLTLLLEAEVPIIKLVDRTFNFDPARARQILGFLLSKAGGSRIHFEIGAHLLDEATLDLLARAPKDRFQFEIGVQSTLPETLDRIGRKTSLQQLEANVRRLVALGNIHLHLDLIAGLPGEGFDDSLQAIDRVLALRPHHLQLEPVKLLPGSPLRQQAAELGLRFDPNPPYSILATPTLSWQELDRLRGISRLLDLTWNSGCFEGFLAGVLQTWGPVSAALESLQQHWQQSGLFRHPLSRQGVFAGVADWVRSCCEPAQAAGLLELLGRDYARCERVIPGKVPDFLHCPLTPEETAAVQQQIRRQTEQLKGGGVKLQHFAAPFSALPGQEGRKVLLFLYLTRSGSGMEVRELIIDPARETEQQA